MATWPATLPQCIQNDSWARDPGNLVLKSEMNAGKPKRRKFFSAAYPTQPVKLTLTRDQWQTLQTFYEDNAAIPFDWTDPLTLLPSEIVFDSKPTIVNRAGAFYVVSFMIEIQI